MLKLSTFALAAGLVLSLALPVSAFDLQAHRGGRGLLPENTLPAFAHALSLGVTTLELDTGITADGVVVVTHNPYLHPDITRDSSGKWLSGANQFLNKLTLKQVKAFDVGRIDPASRTAKRFGSTQSPVDGTHMPTLAQVFALTAKVGNEKMRFNIETKINPLNPQDTVDPQTFAEKLIAVIMENGIADRVTIQSFDWRTLQIVQKLAPEIPTVYLSAQQRWLDNVSGKNGVSSPWTAGFDLVKFGGSVPKMIHQAGGKIWSPFFGDLKPPMVREAHALGLQVIVWTVNKGEHMKGLIAMGVDGIITDYPDRLRKVMKELSMSLPVATPVKP